MKPNIHSELPLEGRVFHVYAGNSGSADSKSNSGAGSTNDIIRHLKVAGKHYKDGVCELFEWVGEKVQLGSDKDHEAARLRFLEEREMRQKESCSLQ